ncbi:hypothetical protein O181_012391 [Austropuccinia psidii MF-1]|uniref:Uncharacterized protein n=1 Tax=Austropuccinia psidii MF-1 TaxID=1389203 RepID=A0A9Q3GM97_9BASI|nr:hypothetical protein [Austropuccinia psidii MF-1]
MPSRCDSDTAPHIRPPHSLRFHTPASFHANAPMAPSRYASDTALLPPASSSLPLTILRLIEYGGLLAYMMNAITEIC